MKRCEVTNKEFDGKYMTKTSDGHWINFDVYKHITFDAKKGILTLKDCMYYYTVNRAFNKAVERYLYNIRSEVEAIFDSKGVEKRLEEIKVCKERLKEFVKLEEDYANKEHNKTINCLTKEEVIDYLSYLEEYPFNKSSRTMVDGKEAQEIFSEYSNYHTSIHFYFE